jgi:tRNA (adenine22-N1)-methyltransferase
VDTAGAEQLRPRLRAIAALIPAGCAVADIGAGDGQLAAALAAAGHRVVATEFRSGPLARLQDRLAGTGAECRAGAGLATLRPDEVDVAVLAGMGGRRISRLLDANPDVVAGLRWLVLQPMQHSEELRSWIEGAGLQVAEDVQVVERGRRYTVLLVRGGALGSG